MKLHILDNLTPPIEVRRANRQNKPTQNVIDFSIDILLESSYNPTSLEM